MSVNILFNQVSSQFKFAINQPRNFICSIDVRCLAIIIGERVDVKEKKSTYL